jgi:hypothetical protein
LDDIVLLGSLPYSKAVQEADMRREAVFGADPEVVEELRRARNNLTKLLSSKVGK